MLGVADRRGASRPVGRTGACSVSCAAVLGGLAIAIGLSGCARPPATREPRRLAPSEVREYKGQRLDSVDDFRENSIKGPQRVDRESYRMRVDGLVERPLALTYDQVLDGRERVEKVVQLDCVEGWSVKILWEGVLVRDLLKQAGVRPDAEVVIFHAADGYSTSFPVEYFDRDIVLASKMNGVTIPEERGFPFQLVAEDKWGYKWCKWVTRIELSSDVSYRGYWERRGYSNGGDRDEGFFEK